MFGFCWWAETKRIQLSRGGDSCSRSRCTSICLAAVPRRASGFKPPAGRRSTRGRSPNTCDAGHNLLEDFQPFPADPKFEVCKPATFPAGCAREEMVKELGLSEQKTA
jgi:hypothetical protein